MFARGIWSIINLIIVELCETINIFERPNLTNQKLASSGNIHTLVFN